MKVFTSIIAALFSASCKDDGSDQSKTVIPDYKDEWKLVEVRPPDSKELWLFRKNIGVSEIKGLKGLSTLVYFTIKFTPKNDTGLPNEEDTKILYDFEEEVIPQVEKDACCILVASVVKGGVKDHLFYVSDPELFIQSLSNHRQELGDFKVSFEKHDDPKWGVYDDFPAGD